MKINSVAGQSAIDVCLMVYGNLDNLASFLVANSIDSVNYVPSTPKTFDYDNSLQSKTTYVYATAEPFSGRVFSDAFGDAFS